MSSLNVISKITDISLLNETKFDFGKYNMLESIKMYIANA